MKPTLPERLTALSPLVSVTFVKTSECSATKLSHSPIIFWASRNMDSTLLNLASPETMFIESAVMPEPLRASTLSSVR